MSNWKIDTAHATAEFKVKHLGVSWVPGQIYGITGDINFDSENVQEAKFKAEIDLNTLTTGNSQRDGHLKSPDFFDVANFPKMKFESVSVEKIDEKNFKIKGNLTIKNISKEVYVDALFLGETDKPSANETMLKVIAFSLKAQVDKRDFGLNWNIDLPGGRLMVGNEVYINVEFEAIKE